MGDVVGEEGWGTPAPGSRVRSSTVHSVFGCINDAWGILTHITKAKLKTKLNLIDSYCYICHLRTNFSEKDFLQALERYRLIVTT